MKKLHKLYKGIMLISSLFLVTSISSCGESSTPIDPDDPGDATHDDLVTPPTYSEDSISIHYYRADRNFEKWALWLWDYPSGTGEEFTFNGVDDYGAVAAYPLSTWASTMVDQGLGFIVKSAGSWDSKDVDGDRIIDFSKFEKDTNNIYNVYLKSGDKNIYANDKWEEMDTIESCQFISSTKIEVKTNTNISLYKIYENDIEIESKTLDTAANSFVYEFSNKVASFDSSYKVEVTFEKSKKVLNSVVSTQTLYKTDEFSKNYTYEGDDLGVTYTSNSSIFKVWSPVSKDIKLRIYNNGTPTSISKDLGDDSYEEFTMTKTEYGVWSTVINEDLKNKYYTYLVTNSLYSSKEIVDPYAKSCGINGLRGQILDLKNTNPEGWDKVEPLQIDRKALTVYETHVSDITSSTSWGGSKENAKLFNGAFESGTTLTSNDVTVTTGFDHIKELGVNAVQLQPIYDQANDETNVSFNWGYNPLNYNCLEGAYSSNPYDGSVRIKEFKKLVQSYNESGINIIMDVVYNHVSSAIGSNFDVLMPGYYFRYTTDGNLSNGSGCGNETASEMPMYRKFMIDSTKFWTKEYKLGGFRFDLMGLHDLTTMDMITEECEKINPSVCIYGEPWTGGTSTLKEGLSAKQINGNSYKGYGQFNDQFRDSLIKGGLNSASALGWVDNMNSKMSSSDMTKLQAGIKGITYNATNSITDPDKSISYVTCHDNYTLYDRFMATGDEGITREFARRMNMLANSVVFTSQGTSFMLAGEEFARTKGGDSNSYQSSYSVNELNYNLKIRNYTMFENYKKLISLKQNLDGLHLTGKENKNLEYSESTDANVIRYTLNDTKNNKEYIVVHANGYKTDSLETVDLENYNLYLDTIDNQKQLSDKTTLSKFETIIAYK